MANENEELSDLEKVRVKKCVKGFDELEKTVIEERLRLEEEMSHLDPEDIRKLFQRKNGTIQYSDDLSEYYKKLWSINLDVMYQQFSEFIENVMESSNKELMETDDELLNSLATGIEDAGRISVGETCSTIHNSDFNTKWRFGIDWLKWFPPLTFHTFLSHYLPVSGAVSHTLYTIHLFSPNIISRLFSTRDFAVSNTILFNANVGLGFYVYFKKHLHCVNPWERVEFSILTSTIFNFISFPAAVLFKSIFPAKSQTWLKTLFATSFSIYLLSGAYRYMGLFDSKNSRSFISTEAMYSDTGKFDSLEVSHLQLTDISDQVIC
ncbi:unnamed protein product [Caenorhabditis angaria]|uniref:Uncharacterized protein n=1 Tax=Caenorhabditis angaria TaxID=860376 RepID=A0A9P1INR1_9PELO|nr:unnamed protein product [Caenorhabditis angaria]